MTILPRVMQANIEEIKKKHSKQDKHQVWLIVLSVVSFLTVLGETLLLFKVFS